MRTTLTWALFAVLLFGYNTRANAQLAATQDELAAARQSHILANLKFQVPQLRELQVVMGEIVTSEHGGLDEGSFTVNGQRYHFLVTADDTRLFMLAGEPLDVSMSADDIAAALHEEIEAATIAAAEVHRNLAAFAEGLPVRGNPNAAVTIFEFSDFQCPYCSRAFTTVEQILARYPGDVKFVFLHYPLSNHPWARPAAIAAVCAAELDDAAFWALHDGYFRDQDSINPENVLAISRELLAVSGRSVDLVAWSDCATNAESEAYQAAATAVDLSLAAGTSFGVSGTPGFFVNGLFVNGAQPLETFEVVIDEALQRSSR